MAVRVQLKGLMRFSYLSENGFAQSVEDLEARRGVLYDPARLERRFRLFEVIAYHTLARQQDLDFSIAVLVGECFPPAWRQRLEDIVADFAPLQIVTLPPMVHIQAVRSAFAALPDDPEATHVATFRQDDDDGIHAMTTNRIRCMAEGLLATRTDDTPFVISFNRGLYFDPAADMRVTEWYERAPLGIGLSLVAPVGDPTTVFRRNHRSLAEYYDCYSEVGRPMWIRSVHPDNDSGAMPQGRRGTARGRALHRMLEDGFGLDPAILEGF